MLPAASGKPGACFATAGAATKTSRYCLRMIVGIYATQLLDELQWLVSGRLGWGSTLFRMSTVGLMEELLVAGRHAEAGVLSPSSFDELSAQVRAQALTDPGLGPMTARGPLLALLPRGSKEFGPASYKFKALAASLPSLRHAYLANWQKEFVGPVYADSSAPAFAHAISPAMAGALLTSHLLQLGMSPGLLSRWFEYLVRYETEQLDLETLTGRLLDRTRTGYGPIEVVVVLERPASTDIKAAQGWFTAGETRTWFSNNGFVAPPRVHGGIRFISDQWDLEGALLSVAKALHRIRQRAILKMGRAPEFGKRAWTVGVGPRTLPDISRVGATRTPGYIFDEPRLEQHASDNRLEVAVDLMSSALAEPGPSAAGILWAALEALLAAPGDANRVLVADRATDIALVALVRSSIQISIGVLLSRGKREALAMRVQPLDGPNRLLELESALRNDEHLAIQARAVRLTLSHTKALFDAETLSARRVEIRNALLGLYRHRNLVLHGGITDGPLLEAVLRATTPITAAVVNRYARAVEDGATDPHVFAFEMSTRLERYLADPLHMVTFW